MGRTDIAFLWVRHGNPPALDLRIDRPTVFRRSLLPFRHTLRRVQLFFSIVLKMTVDPPPLVQRVIQRGTSGDADQAFEAPPTDRLRVDLI
jgi:hypothetical protein